MKKKTMLCIFLLIPPFIDMCVLQALMNRGFSIMGWVGCVGYETQKLSSNSERQGVDDDVIRIAVVLVGAESERGFS